MTSLLLLFTTLATTFATPDVQTYDGLLRAIRSVQAESQKRMEQAIDKEKVREAWEIGKLIDAHVLHHKERADFGKQVIERLASDLGTSTTELRHMLGFFRAYPIHAPARELSWAHYRELLSLNESEAREEVMDEAVRKHWSRNQVRQEVRRRKAISTSQEIEKIPARGPLYTYRVVKPAEGPYAGELALDLGFEVTFRPPSLDLAAFKKGDTVALRDGKLIQVKDPVGTYQAYVSEIIDGDTFHARIDLGFDVTLHQKLRLRGLDAPVVESSDGREAKAFLEKHLPAKGSGKPTFIMISKSDKYDRYLSDVWVPAGEVGDKAEYLNQLLLDQGLAVKVEE